MFGNKMSTVALYWSEVPARDVRRWIKRGIHDSRFKLLRLSNVYRTLRLPIVLSERYPLGRALSL